VRTRLKRLSNLAARLVVAPLTLACALERRLFARAESVFVLCAQGLAVMPGRPGVFMRAAFYESTLAMCGPNLYVSFGAFFTHRVAEVGTSVYVGPYALVGAARLGDGCSIGSRASVLSGTALHEPGADGRWTPYHVDKLRMVSIGEHVLVGEGAILMADIGPRSLVTAGAVVSAPMPGGIVVAGNPARYVRKLEWPREATPEQGASA
jgi:acetyltransferase-like isoleucine patch superfamily enzyme